MTPRERRSLFGTRTSSRLLRSTIDGIAIDPCRAADGGHRTVEGAGHVGLAVHLPEDQRVGLPVPDRVPPADLGGTMGNGPLERDLHGPGLAAKAPAPLPPGAEQMAMELQCLAPRAVDELADGLVAQACIRTCLFETAGDLLGRPLIATRSIRSRRDAGAGAQAALEPGDDVATQAVVPA